MLPMRHRGQRWRTMSATVEILVALPFVILPAKTFTLTDGGRNGLDTWAQRETKEH